MIVQLMMMMIADKQHFVTGGSFFAMPVAERQEHFGTRPKAVMIGTTNFLCVMVKSVQTTQYDQKRNRRAVHEEPKESSIDADFPLGTLARTFQHRTYTVYCDIVAIFE